MPYSIVIRPEVPSDALAIAEVTREAFLTHRHSIGTEGFIIDALRRVGALSISLVAEIDGKVVGHVAFSPVTVDDGARGWYALGPLSVKPGYQGGGIGQALVRKGLATLRELDGQGCVVVGDTGYYGRFGFQNRPGLVFAGIPQEVFLALSLREGFPQGEVKCHEVFYAKY